MICPFPATVVSIVSRPKLGGAVEHDGILRETEHSAQLIELHPDRGLCVRDWYEGPSEEGFVVRLDVPGWDLEAADERLHQVFAQRPEYAAAGPNCQHFASYVASGRGHSRDLEAIKSAGKVLASVLAVGFVLKLLLR